MKRRLPEDKVRILTDKQKRPINVEMLKHPRCNPHIWMKLKAATRRGDIRLGHVGDKMIKLLIANTKTVASLAKLKDEIKSNQKKQVKDITRELLDATQIGVMGLHELNQKRRSDIRPTPVI